MSLVGIRKLCTPAMVYLLLSVFALIIMGYQNRNNVNVYCLGEYACQTTSVLLIFLVKIVYVVFWTWILNLICKSGYTSIAWLLLLLPYILLFILLIFFLFM
jgi:hypothetical protein